MIEDYQRKITSFHTTYCPQWSTELLKQKLHKCSGILSILKKYIEVREDIDRMDEWDRSDWFTEEDDKILMTGYPQDLRTLHRKESINRRYAYLGFKLRQ